MNPELNNAGDYYSLVEVLAEGITAALSENDDPEVLHDEILDASFEIDVEVGYEASRLIREASNNGASNEAYADVPANPELWSMQLAESCIRRDVQSKVVEMMELDIDLPTDR